MDLTQQEFADRIGVKRNTVATYELGRNKPVDAVMSLICREFHVNEEWLRNGTGEMFQPQPRDELDMLLEKYNLPGVFRSLISKFLDLKPDQREAVIGYMHDVAADLMEMDSVTADSVDQHAIWEAEARAEAERVYQEVLQEKREEAGLSASPRGGGVA